MSNNSIRFGKFNIYILENDIHNIKIGITQNFEQRLKSLQNSNSGGHKIINMYVSPDTYLYTLESLMHLHFNKYRIEGEWFKGIDFNEAVNYLNFLMSEENHYELMNQIRKQFNQQFDPSFKDKTDENVNLSKQTVKEFWDSL